MYNRVRPSLTIDVTDMVEKLPRNCTVCGGLAEYECKACSIERSMQVNYKVEAGEDYIAGLSTVFWFCFIFLFLVGRSKFLVIFQESRYIFDQQFVCTLLFCGPCLPLYNHDKVADNEIMESLSLIKVVLSNSIKGF